MNFPALLAALALSVPAIAAEENAPARLNARIMQMPAVSKDQIAFVYAGDIWIVPRTGGLAARLSSPRGMEQFPKFSPDGTEIAFSGNYEGNVDVYVMPVSGGEPRRITHHGAPDRLLGWYPDGKSLLYQSEMISFTQRTGQFFKVSAQGGLPEQLPIPYGEFGAISPDGKKLAYTPISTDFATWKRYRGGMAADIWIYDLEKGTAENVTNSDANDSQPMWAGTTLYFLSDRDAHQRANIWACDTVTKQMREVTHFTDFDVRFPSIGPDAIVFENAGSLHLLDLGTEQVSDVEIKVVTDRATLRPQVENLGNAVRNGTISPTGKRVLFEARGEIFSVPAEHGVIRDLTGTSGVAERYPAWSPDGKWIAYFSDRSGEYELTLRPADGKGEEQAITHLGAGYRYQPFWSPDAKKIAFIDSSMRVHLTDVEKKQDTIVDQEKWLYQGALEQFAVSWSADSRWFAFARDQENQHSAIALCDAQDGSLHQVTSGFFDDDLPVFDPDGKYLYYRTKRWFDALYSEHDPSWIYVNGHALIAVPLRKDVPSPLAARNDEEPGPGAKKSGDSDKKDDKPADDKKPENKEEPKKDDDKKAEVAINEQKPSVRLRPSEAKPPDAPAKAEEKKPKPVAIDLEGFEARAVALPPAGSRYAHLIAVPGKLLFSKQPRAGSSGPSPLISYDLEKREEKTIIDDAGGVELSADGKKLLVARGGQWAIITPAENQKFDKPLPIGSLEAVIDPVQEWRQIFNDAWRIERDFFYDPYLHLVPWQKMRERYGALLEHCATRSDLNYVIGELIAELNVSHAYRGGGDLEGAPGRSVGYLGCDFALDQGAYRIKRILEVAPWEYTVRAPLRQPGLNVKEGDWLLAVNGRPIDVSRDPWAAFQGLAEKPVILSVNDKPNLEGAREVLVQTIGSETWLRQYAWIEQNRRRVDAASGGQIGYIYVRDTGQDGQNELFRQFRAQFAKPGLIIDERWNAGGQIPDRFIELLGRKVTNFWAVRDGQEWQTPTIAHRGAKAILTNGWSGSGGDCFPWLFKQSGLGPIIGTRTWGGLIGMTGCPPLIDGGHVTVPTFSIYDTAGKWVIEGHGVDPDIAVLDDPAEMAKVRDPQLERAIEEVQKTLKANPPRPPQKPSYPNRAGN
jgi:tricorn protease